MEGQTAKTVKYMLKYIPQDEHKLWFDAENHLKLARDLITPEEYDGHLWSASMVLLNYLQERKNELVVGKSVFELGAGLGHLGVALVDMGAKSTLLTEYHTSVETLRSSVQSLLKEPFDQANANAICCEELDWGTPGYQKLVTLCESKGIPMDFDLVIASEIFYEESLHDLLVDTFEQIFQRRENAQVYSVFLDRPFSQAIFAKMHDRGGFSVEYIKDFDPLGLVEVFIYKIAKAK